MFDQNKHEAVSGRGGREGAGKVNTEYTKQARNTKAQGCLVLRNRAFFLTPATPLLVVSHAPIHGPPVSFSLELTSSLQVPGTDVAIKTLE